MPVLKRAKQLPDWCELKHYEIIRLEAGDVWSVTLNGRGYKEKWICCEGAGIVSKEERQMPVFAGTALDFAAEEDAVAARISVREGPFVLIRMFGQWGEEVGGCGVFRMEASELPGNDGDPAEYPRNTFNDNHYHDCDEYYIIYDGFGVVVTESRHYIVGAGDCVVTAAGDHHDIPIVVKPLKAVFFETTLIGRKRRGHLWNHTHGPATPDPAKRMHCLT
ncbi:hypothetical protein [Paenibacillus sp.]|uniref:hypothetical protein n=1 Tax=Paenibacillus sp. TaxID=58172 RepID=UPI002D6CD768|nr:hypothetical protein [Paenibacillus sp.]HZG87772.1 hypothetical protein [Paenibacillus sp.]